MSVLRVYQFRLGIGFIGWWVAILDILQLTHCRAGHKSPHEDNIGTQFPVSLLDARTTNDSFIFCDAGGGTVDVSSYRVHDVSNVSDATTVLERGVTTCTCILAKAPRTN
jgi:hypothetical protein